MGSDEQARSTCGVLASSLCGAVCGNGRWLAADVDGLLVPIDRREDLAPRRR